MDRNRQQVHKIRGMSGVREIARHAGVSTATVSRAFNEPEKVRQALRDRVLQVAAELDYSPNTAARELTSARSFRIGAAIPTIDNAIFAKFVEALGSALAEQRYALMLATYEFDREREAAAVRNLVSAGIDGLVLTGIEHDPAIYRLADTRRLPYVLTSIIDETDTHPSIGYDNARGGRLVVEHLLALGHRRIGIIAGQTDRNDRARLRLQGMRAALADHAERLAPAAVVERPFSVAEGRSGLAEILESEPGITAVVCANDVLASGALYEAAARGLSVPRDLSVTGFDGSDLAGACHPAITTVSTPTEAMGREAALYLTAAANGKEPRRRNTLPCALVQGGSTGPVLAA